MLFLLFIYKNPIAVLGHLAIDLMTNVSNNLPLMASPSVDNCWFDSWKLSIIYKSTAHSSWWSTAIAITLYRSLCCRCHFGTVGSQSYHVILFIIHTVLEILVLLVLFICGFVFFAFCLMDSDWKTQEMDGWQWWCEKHNWEQSGKDVILISYCWNFSLVSGFS
jgi:hypothetical protein